jgi:hypothetical protein
MIFCALQETQLAAGPLSELMQLGSVKALRLAVGRGRKAYERAVFKLTNTTEDEALQVGETCCAVLCCAVCAAREAAPPSCACESACSAHSSPEVAERPTKGASS